MNVAPTLTSIWARITALWRVIDPKAKYVWVTTWIRLRVKLENGAQTQMWMPGYFALEGFKGKFDSEILRNSIKDSGHIRERVEKSLYVGNHEKDVYRDYIALDGKRLNRRVVESNPALRPILEMHRQQQQQEGEAFQATQAAQEAHEASMKKRNEGDAWSKYCVPSTEEEKEIAIDVKQARASTISHTFDFRPTPALALQRNRMRNNSGSTSNFNDGVFTRPGPSQYRR
jgi:hypothetical protein